MSWRRGSKLESVFEKVLVRAILICRTLMSDLWRGWRNRDLRNKKRLEEYDRH